MLIRSLVHGLHHEILKSDILLLDDRLRCFLDVDIRLESPLRRQLRCALLFSREVALYVAVLDAWYHPGDVQSFQRKIFWLLGQTQVDRLHVLVHLV